MSEINLLPILDRLDFFQSFSPVEKSQLLSQDAMIKVFPKNEFLIMEADKSSNMFILLKGKVRVTKGKKYTTIAELDAGDFFGDMSFLTGRPRTTNVMAIDEVIAITFDKTILNKLDQGIREKIKDQLIERLVERLETMNQLYI